MAAAWSYFALGVLGHRGEGEGARDHGEAGRAGGGGLRRAVRGQGTARARVEQAPEMCLRRSSPPQGQRPPPFFPFLFPSSMAAGTVAVLAAQEAQRRGGQMRARGRERMGSMGNEAGSEQLLRGNPCLLCTLVTFSLV
jgi:hypothetical protein